MNYDITILLFLALAASGPTLPEGPGKDLTEKMCKTCHGVENIVRSRMTKERWSEVVDDMVMKGAVGTDDEIDQVIDYLAANFPFKTVNVNKASADDLSSDLGISAADAAAIVKSRTVKGSFKVLQDLTKIPGIDAKRIQKVKDRIEF